MPLHTEIAAQPVQLLSPPTMAGEKELLTGLLAEMSVFLARRHVFPPRTVRRKKVAARGETVWRLKARQPFYLEEENWRGQTTVQTDTEKEGEG